MGFMVIEIDNTSIFGTKDCKETYTTAIKIHKDYDVNITFKFIDDISYGNWQQDYFIHWEIDKHYIKGDKHYRGIGEGNMICEVY